MPKETEFEGKTGEDAVFGVPKEPSGFENLCEDEKLTWMALRSLCNMYPLAELFLCLMLITRRGVTEFEVLECFRLASEHASTIDEASKKKRRRRRRRRRSERKKQFRAQASPKPGVSPRADLSSSPNHSPRALDSSRQSSIRPKGHVPAIWITSHPLSTCLRCVRSYHLILHVTCAGGGQFEWICPLCCIKILLLCLGFGSTLASSASSACSAETRAVELPHILYCTLDSNFTREHTQVQEQISADKQRLLDCMVSAPQLHHGKAPTLRPVLPCSAR